MPIFHRLLRALPLLFVLAASGLSPLHAQTSNPQPAPPTTSANPAQALVTLSKQLDGIKTALTSPSANVPLNDLRTETATVQQQAGEWVGILTPQRDSVQARLTVLGPPPAAGAPAETPAVSQQRKALTRSKSSLDGQIQQAQQLSQDAGKLTAQIGQVRREKFQQQLSSRTSSPISIAFWSDLKQAFPDDQTRLQRIEGLLSDGITAAWTPPNRVPLLLCLIAATLLLIPGRWLVERALLAVVGRYMPDGHLRRSGVAVMLTLTVTLSIGVAAWLVYLGLNWNGTLDDDLDSLARAVVRAAFFGAFIAGLGRALLSAKRPSWRLPALSDTTAKSLRWFPWLLGASFLLLGAIEHLNTVAGGSLPATVLSRAVLALLISSMIGAALVRLKRARKLSRDANAPEPAKHALWIGIIATLAGLGVLLTWLCVLTGYIAFGFFIAWQMLWIGMIVSSFYIATHFVRDVLNTLLSPKTTTGQRLNSSFGITPATLDQASVVLSAASYLLLLLVAVGTVLMPFGGGPHDLVSHIGDVFTNLEFGQLKISPVAVLRATLMFVAGLIVVRIAKRWLTEQFLPKTKLDPGMQTSLVTLLGYVAVVIVVALALRTADVSLQSLTWIASALSVGIGFGLQAIVQNFISGLILLAEQPVKVGDWVSMPGVEGDIRRINVRATEIQLSDRSTMIVPNSQLITQNLRNVTHGNALGRVKVSLPMPLDTDPAKVRQIILEALKSNTAVLPSPAPSVTLDDITSSAMTFTGVAYVRSPRDASTIKSGVLFDILERLAKASLPLSSPQSMVLSGLNSMAENSPAAPSQ